MSIRIVWLIAIFVSAVCYIYRYELVDLLYSNSNLYWGEVLGCLMLSFVFIMIGYITGPLLTASGHIHKLNWIFVISIIVNIGLNWLLIQQYKAYGAAIATLFTQGFVMLAQIGFVHRQLDFSLSNYPMRQMIFGALALIVGIVVLKNVAPSTVYDFIGLLVIGMILMGYLAIYVRKELASERIDLSNE